MKLALYGYSKSLMPKEAWDNLAIFGDLATVLAKNKHSRNFESRIYRPSWKRDTGECSRRNGEIVNFARQTPL